MQFSGPWEPIETLPWEIDSDFDEDSDAHWRLPIGIALRRSDHTTEHVLIGDDIARYRSSGCDCCSAFWRKRIVNFDGWKWIIRL